MNKERTFLYNALLLIGVSLAMRTIGMYFNVYISNKIGAEAMGVYSLVGGVYGFGITLATSGINLAVMRLISKDLGVNKNISTISSMKKCLIYATFFGVLSGTVLLSTSKIIAYYWLDDLRTIKSLRILAISLPFIALSSALNGYFTAIRKSYKNAITVFLEQLIKIAITVFLLLRILPEGIENACISLALGTLGAEILSFLSIAILYIKEKKQTPYTLYGNKTTKNHLRSRELFSITLPIAFSSYIRSALISIEHSLIPQGLRKFGASYEISLAAYGTLQSMVFPAILFPAVFLTSFSSLLIPELSESQATQNNNKIKKIISSTIRITLIFGIGTAGIIFNFSDELGEILYHSAPNAGTYMLMMAPLIPIMYLDSMIDVMLKGLGQQVYSMIVNIIDSFLSVILVWSVVPKFGVAGYIVVIYICELMNASLSFARLIAKSKSKIDIINWIFKPLMAIIGSVAIIRIITLLIDTYNSFQLCFSIIFTIIMYLILLLGLFAILPSEIRLFKVQRNK